MTQNFRSCDRDQPLLLPPDLRDWLPEDHLAWFVIEAVDELDLEPFYGAYRADGHGAAAHEPKMMVTLFAYAYCVGERSSRAIERRCREDIAFRVICANQIPDHATIARFRVRHEDALADLFGQVLGLCAKAEIIDPAVLAVDGSKFAAAASDSAIRTYEQIAAEILAEAGRIDAAEHETHGEARGDELPRHLTSTQGRSGWLREAKKASRPSALPDPSRFHASAPSASSSATPAWPRTGALSTPQTAPSRTTTRTAAEATGAATARRRSPTRLRLGPRARSTPPTLTPGG